MPANHGHDDLVVCATKRPRFNAFERGVALGINKLAATVGRLPFQITNLYSLVSFL